MNAAMLCGWIAASTSTISALRPRSVSVFILIVIIGSYFIFFGLVRFVVWCVNWLDIAL